MKKLILVFVAAFGLAFAGIVSKNGVPVGPSSTINGRTPLSAINGQTIVGGGSSAPTVLWWKLNDAGGSTITADVGPNGTTNGTLTGTDLVLTGSQTATADSNTTFGVQVCTVTFWWKLTQWSTGATPHYAINYGYGAVNGTFLVAEQFGDITSSLYDGGGVFGRTLSTSGMTDDTYYFFSIVFDNSVTNGAIKVYRNGTLQTTTPIGNTNSTGNIAARTPVLGTFDGSIDDVRFYVGELTADDISAIYSAGRQ